MLGHVLGGDAHVVVVDGALQAVADHLVLEHAVAHAVALAGLGEQVGGEAHVLHAAGHHDLGVAAGDGLGGQMDGLHARAAHLVDDHRRDLVGQAGGMEGQAGGVLALTGLQHVAHDDFLRPRGSRPALFTASAIAMPPSRRRGSRPGCPRNGRRGYGRR